MPSKTLLDALHLLRMWRTFEIRRGLVFGTGDAAKQRMCDLPTFRRLEARGWLKQQPRNAARYDITKEGMQAWIEHVASARPPSRRTRATGVAQ